MLTLVHILVTLYCVFECVSALRDTRTYFPRLMMFSALGLVHGVAPAITPEHYWWMGSSEGDRINAGLLALVGVVLFSIGWRAYESLRPQWTGLSPGLSALIESPDGQRFLKRFFWLSAVLSISAWLGGVVATGGQISEVFEGGRFEGRLTGNYYVSAIFNHLTTLIFVPGFLCFFLPRHYRIWGISFALTMAVVMFLATKGARSTSMGLVGCVVTGYAIRNRMSARQIGMLVASGTVLVLLGTGLYKVRKVMVRKSLGEMAQMLVQAETYEGAITSDPLCYHQFLVAAVHTFPARHPFVHAATYRRMCVFFVPRAYFPQLKPEDVNMIFAAAINPASAKAATTIPPTMMGDGYINFWGWPGVAIMLVNGWFCGFLTGRLRADMLWFLLIGSQIARFSMMSIRGQPYELMTVMLTAFLLVWVCGRLLGYSYRRARYVAAEVDHRSAYAGLATA